MLVGTAQDDQDQFRGDAEPDRDKGDADAAGDENRAAGTLAQAADIFLAVPTAVPGGADTGEMDLAAVGVPAEHEVDSLVGGDEFRGVGIVREDDAGRIRRDAMKGPSEINVLFDKIAYPRDTQGTSGNGRSG